MLSPIAGRAGNEPTHSPLGTSKVQPLGLSSVEKSAPLGLSGLHGQPAVVPCLPYQGQIQALAPAGEGLCSPSTDLLSTY